MKKLNDEDIQAYFLAGNSGFWKVESEEGKKTRLYTDEITDELFGITEDLSPEKMYGVCGRTYLSAGEGVLLGLHGRTEKP